MFDVLEELQWRGLLSHTTDIEALRAALAEGPVTFYCGFDPTAPSLHHGHLVQILTMRHIQNAGHKPLALVGGATGLIGDPREKGERTLNSKEVVKGWVERLRTQISKVLVMDGDNPAVIVNNLDWTAQISAIDFLRDLGKHFRLGTMLAKDSVAKRLNSEEGISFTEFSYQLLQANDFVELNKRYNCILETGGQDQWGNIVGGVDLVRKITGKSVHALTTKLITKSDGTKFGKTEGGAVWLDPTMLSPYKFYQFWINSDDNDVVHLLKTFTFLSREQIDQLEETVRTEPHLRRAQKVLAHEVTALVHGEQKALHVAKASEVIFGKADVADLDAETLLEAVDQLPGVCFNAGGNVLDALVEIGLEKGRGAARRTLQAGGVAINNQRVLDEDRLITMQDALPGNVVLLRKGKKNISVLYLQS